MTYIREASRRVFHWHENCPDIGQDNRIIHYNYDFLKLTIKSNKKTLYTANQQL